VRYDYSELELDSRITLRMFPDIEQDMINIMKMKKHRGRWESKSHFCRCAVIKYIQDLKREVD
jgi:hypothetical protein